MLRRHFLGLLMILALPATSLADEGKSFTAAEIEALLAGNTAIGEWDGTAYRQYFGPDGSTTYLPEGGEADEGKWRVNAENDLYESWWESTGWVAYGVERRNGQLHWVDDGKGQPFIVRQGELLQGD